MICHNQTELFDLPKRNITRAVQPVCNGNCRNHPMDFSKVYAWRCYVFLVLISLCLLSVINLNGQLTEQLESEYEF